MIGFLRGILIEKNPECIVIEVSGVGYEIEVPATTLCQLPALNHEVSLYILTHVREDAIRLFGFTSSFDKKVFQNLLNVSGIGPKAALALLSSIDGYDLCEVINSGQIAKLTAIPGIGLKTAERLLLELKDKTQKLISRKKDEIEIQKSEINLSVTEKNNRPKISQKVEQKIIRRQIIEDLKSALSNLGYKDRQYSDIVSSFDQRMQLGENISIEIALKESLSKLSERIIQKH